MGLPALWASLHHNLDIDRVAKPISPRVDRLPCALVHPRLCRGSEQDADHRLRTRARRVERLLARCAQRRPGEQLQPVTGIPVARAAVQHLPAFVQYIPWADQRAVRDAQVFLEGQVVRAGWGRRGNWRLLHRPGGEGGGRAGGRG